MLFALPGYQFPCTVMNMCLYLLCSSTKLVVDNIILGYYVQFILQYVHSRSDAILR
jgi:hypothetical protein